MAYATVLGVDPWRKVRECECQYQHCADLPLNQRADVKYDHARVQPRQEPERPPRASIGQSVREREHVVVWQPANRIQPDGGRMRAARHPQLKSKHRHNDDHRQHLQSSHAASSLYLGPRCR